MKSVAKVVIMCVRAGTVASAVLGILVLIGKIDLAGIHAVIGYGISLALVFLAARGIRYRLGILPLFGLLIAAILPLSGRFQLMASGVPTILTQFFHIVIALAAIGLAEVLNGKIQRA